MYIVVEVIIAPLTKKILTKQALRKVDKCNGFLHYTLSRQMRKRKKKREREREESGILW